MMGRGLEETSQCASQELSISSPGPLSLSSVLLVLEKIRSAVGSTQLLLSQKVQQFFRLCQQSLVSV